MHHQQRIKKLNQIRHALSDVLKLSEGFKPHQTQSALYWMQHDLEIILGRIREFREAIGDKEDAA